MAKNIAPGARVTIRDEDWIVRRIDLCDDGGHALSCDGLSELVRGTSAIFLDRLEDDIAVHDPASTQLFQDESPYFGQALLYLESQRLRTVANDQQMHRAHQAAMQSAAYQRVPAEKAQRMRLKPHLHPTSSPTSRPNGSVTAPYAPTTPAARPCSRSTSWSPKPSA
ncbi:hypothetical protein ABC977_06960 [Thioalkalicoccus limnaeus]|uniref:Uncharacterized protein n=1 Tax=Thioalkalicoccus limnaeus TaxID=120681 RepID=A0ABV4BCJ6_9GAMM